MKVSINSVDLAIFALVMDVRKDIIPPREWSTGKVPGKAGAYLFKKTIDPRIFEIDIKFIGDVESQRRGMAAIIDSDGLVPLEFGDRPGIEYMGVVVGETGIQRNSHTGDATISFFVPDPYGYGDEMTALIGESGLLEVSGDAEVYPRIEAEFTTGSTFFGITDGEDFLLVGEPGEVDSPVVQLEQRVMWEELDTVTGWATWGGTPDDGIIAGEMLSNGSSFYSTNIGTGNKWHGPAVVKSIGAPVQDFLLDAMVTQRSRSNPMVGRVEIYLLDTNGAVVAKMILRRSDPNEYLNYGFARIGQGTTSKYLIDNKSKRLNGFQSGHLRLRRDGQKFSASIQKVENGKVVASVGGSYVDVKNEYQAPIAQVVIAIAGYGTFPLSTSTADDIKIYKLNKPTQPDSVDQLFKAGDKIVIDTKDGTIFHNGNNIVGRLNPQSNFFSLQPGTQAIGLTASGTLKNVKVIYKSRWI